MRNQKTLIYDFLVTWQSAFLIVIWFIFECESATTSFGTSTSLKHMQKTEPIVNKKWEEYDRTLAQKWDNKDYLAAIFEDEPTRLEFVHLLNDGLPQEIKDDLKALKIRKTVDEGELSRVLFNPDMDTWLGMLPAWVRFKHFMFSKLDTFITAHPHILNNTRVYQTRRG